MALLLSGMKTEVMRPCGSGLFDAEDEKRKFRCRARVAACASGC